MSLHRRTVTALLAAVPAWAAGLPGWAQGQPRPGSATLGIALEPPGLDPTTAPAAAIGEVVLYNVFEGLTRITMDGAVLPLLAENWSHTPDGKTYSFVLRQGVRFSDGAPFDASAVKFSFERAMAPASANRARKSVFDNISSVVVDGPHRVILVLHNADAVLPFRLGESSAVILHPATAADAADRPVGTGPYRLERWDKGRSHAGALGRPSQPRGSAAEPGELPLPQRAGSAAGGAAGGRGRRHAALKQLQADKRFGVQIGVTAGKGILAINNRKPPFNDLRVRRALAHAVDRKAFISGAQEGLGRPIGSHFAPLNVGYVELSGRYPYDPAKARALLREAGVRTPLNVTLSLPPPPYARIGGPIIAAQLAQVGVMAKIEHLDWDQWTAGPYKGDFDLTLFNHVDPLDYAATYADPDNYFGYDSARFRGLVAVLDATTDPAQKARLWRSIQTQLADDAVNVFIWNPAQVAVARRGLRGLWVNSPIFANDLSALSWAAP